MKIKNLQAVPDEIYEYYNYPIEGKCSDVAIINNKQAEAYYQAADIYIHAAKADTFPNVVLEALACGLPVVATAVGGIPEQIDHERTGFLVPPGDAAGMAEARACNFSNARARWLTCCFSAAVISAKVRVSPSGTNIGS